MNYIVILYKIKKPMEEYRSKVICLYDFSLSSHPEIISLEANKNILVLNKIIVKGNSVAFNYLSVLTNQEKKNIKPIIKSLLGFVYGPYLSMRYREKLFSSIKQTISNITLSTIEKYVLRWMVKNICSSMNIKQELYDIIKMHNG